MSAKKKIVLATDFFYPHWTGISKAIWNMTRVLADRFDFTVLTVRYDRSLKPYEEYGSVRVFRDEPLFTLSRAYYSASLVHRAISEIARADTVFINCPNTNILPLAIAAKISGKRLLCFHQGDLILPSGLSNALIQSLYDGMNYIGFSLADAVASYTRDYAEHSRVLKPHLHKFQSFLMPVLTGKPHAHASAAIEALRELRKKGVTIFGIAGRFVQEKGFDVLFRAIPRMKTRKSFIFAFAGAIRMSYENTFDEIRNLSAPIEDKIRYLGLLNDEELPDFYSSIDYFVLPSRSECFGLVQAEAALAGIPVLAADIPGARMLVKTTGFGALFESENPDELARVLDSVMESGDRFSEKYSNVLQMLDPTTNAEKIATFLG
ncbi:MAG: glycosyltransferase family 4 protein [Patescibacteria group bacterium]|nr:glycosyltransferase family 4 protein [Patescibacteria group bacterium]